VSKLIFSIAHVFEIIDYPTIGYQLKIKEALHINKIKPELNIQVRDFNAIFNPINEPLIILKFIHIYG
jgi:hypothetical protein